MDLNNTPDNTNQFTTEDIEKNKLVAALSYFFLLVLIPILTAKDSPFAKFHANQGIVLIIFDLAIGVASWFLGIIPIIGGLVSWLLYLVVVVLSIVGIINALQGKAKQLPIIGGIQILK